MSSLSEGSEPAPQLGCAGLGACWAPWSVGPPRGRLTGWAFSDWIGSSGCVDDPLIACATASLALSRVGAAACGSTVAGWAYWLMLVVGAACGKTGESLRPSDDSDGSDAGVGPGLESGGNIPVSCIGCGAGIVGEITVGSGTAV
jgi:hypothetical protein